MRISLVMSMFWAISGTILTVSPALIVVGITYSGPNANYDSLRAVDYTPRAAASRNDLPARLFVAVGDQEPLSAPVRDFVEALSGRNYRSLMLESRIIEGERHSRAKPEAFHRGLRFLFQQR